MIAIKLLTWLIPISTNIYLDRKGAKRNYLQVNIIRGIAAILHGAWLLPSSEDYNYSQASSLDLLLVWAPILLFQLTSYWLLFEIGYNLVRRRPLLDYDRIEKDSGWVDKIFKWAGPVAHVYAKLLALVLLILTILSLYENY